MRKKILICLLGFSASIFLAAGLMAQEKVEVSVKVTKDGQIVTDTTYQFEDASEARHAMKMMEVLSANEKHMEHVTYNISSTHAQGGHSRAMVFISEDGEEFNITELHSDSLKWISEGDEPHGEHVIIRKSKDGETFDVFVDEDHGGEKVKVIVIEDHDEDVDHDEDEDEDVEVKVIKKKVKK
jgi:hypothetical protein